MSLKIREVRLLTVHQAMRGQPAYGWQCGICVDYSVGACVEVVQEREHEGTVEQMRVRYHGDCVEDLRLAVVARREARHRRKARS